MWRTVPRVWGHSYKAHPKAILKARLGATGKSSKREKTKISARRWKFQWGKVGSKKAEREDTVCISELPNTLSQGIQQGLLLPKLSLRRKYGSSTWPLGTAALWQSTGSWKSTDSLCSSYKYFCWKELGWMSCRQTTEEPKSCHITREQACNNSCSQQLCYKFLKSWHRNSRWSQLPYSVKCIFFSLFNT